MSGVTDQGFEAKRLAEVLSDAADQLRTIVDPVSGESLQPNFEAEDPAMQVVQVPLEGTGAAWEAMQLVYQQFDESKATGASQSALVQLNGIERLDEAPSNAQEVLTGTPLALIPAGQLVSDVNNTNQWATTTDVTLDAFGTATVTVRCTVNGPVAAAAGTLSRIVTPYPGLSSVNNPADAVLGRNIESDTELRQRQRLSTMAPASSPVESIYGNLANVAGVTYVRVRQNNTLVPDSNGIPGKSVAAVIVGGEPLDIAMTLLARTGVAAEWFGSSSLTLTDVQGEPYVVKWTVPTPAPIYIELTLEIINPGIFPADGLQQIKDAIKEYAKGGAPALGVEDGFSATGFPPGATVIWSRLFTPINFVPGHRVVSLFIGTAPGPTLENDIAVAWNQVALFLDDNIDITVI
ncbi:Baseplate J-like protein [compost metagenome]